MTHPKARSTRRPVWRGTKRGAQRTGDDAERYDEKARAAFAQAGLEPLMCERCGAPMPVGPGDETTCLSCGQKARLPESYRVLRDARRLSEDDAAQLRALAADISRPPPRWERAAMIVGYAVGGITVVTMALGALVGAIGGLVAASEVGLGDTVAKIFTVVGALAVGLLAVPFASEWLVALALLHTTGAADQVVSGAAFVFKYDLIAAGVLYFFGVVPIALAVRTQANLDGVLALQGRLAAQPSTERGGAPCCRHCGGALDVARGALVSRCLYCNSDNLLQVPLAVATAHREQARALDADIRDAVAQRARERADDRTTMWTLLLSGLLLGPFLCGAGYALHTVMGV